MTPQQCMGALRLATVAALLAAGPALAESQNAKPLKETTMVRIQVIVGDKTLVATLDDTPAGRDFAALMPLELTLADYNSTEKVADLPRRIDTTGAPGSYTPKPGDITYYAPWGNLAIFYKAFRNSAGLVRLGAFDGPVDALGKAGAVPVRIKLAE